jgi:xylan 1,4-beta-xylosidase
MARIGNPILPGFHPDPCIIRVGDWFYIANSTFEWWPGVRIHRSRDLASWELVGGALTRRSQLDLRGVPDSGGVWAPALSHWGGLFWLVYSDVKSLNGPFKDVRNYLVTSEKAEGPWSEPVSLNSSGFDPSLFHDEDGRKWLLNQTWDPRPGRDAFAGIALQEYSEAERRLVGSPVSIFGGSGLGVTEGPHMYKRDGFYYLLTAEGGTGWEHAVTVARSGSLFGPYEIHPENPILTSKGHPVLELQKVGHGSFVHASDDWWYLAHLCSRPVGPGRRCLLGRETAIQPIDWPVGDWPRLSGGGNAPLADFEIPGVPGARPYLPEFADEFDGPDLNPHWNTLREPAEGSWLSLDQRKGFLRLFGRHSLVSWFSQSLVGFRLLHHECTVDACLEFTPRSWQQSAGLVLYYNTANFYYLHVTIGDGGSRCLQLLASDNRRIRQVLEAPIAIAPAGAVELSANLSAGRLQFQASWDSRKIPIGPALDATTLSDDYPMEGGAGWSFTGPFAALCAQDSGDSGVPADFDWFRYRSLLPTVMPS